MTLQRIAGLCSFWIVIASAAAVAQPGNAVNTLQSPGIEGKWEPFRQIVTEARGTAPDPVRSTRDLRGFSLEGRPRLVEKTESTQQTATDGRTTVVRNAWSPDLDGHLRLSFQQIEETRGVPPDIRESVVTILLPDLDRRLREAQRTEYSARQIGPNVIQHDTTLLFRDVNRRWRVAEIRSLVVRGIGPSEWIEEETILRPDPYGTVAVSERHITRRSEADGREEAVTETYAPAGPAGYVARRGPSVRVRTSTTAAADGGRNTVEEVETLSPAAPAEPLHVTRRSVETVRRAGPDRWATERQVFERDVNGRMRPVHTETEEHP
jgi:hypothetical protein